MAQRPTQRPGEKSSDSRAKAEFRNLLRLPAEISARFYDERLSQVPLFRWLVNQYAEQEFKFIPERTQVFIGASASVESEFLSQPFTLSIVPSFQYFAPDARGHEAVGISVFQSPGREHVIATEATIEHHPFKIAEFRTVDLARGKRFARTSVVRQELLEQTVEELAERLGPVDIDPPLFERPPGGTLEADNAVLVESFLESTMRDIYSSPLYPEGGIDELLADTPLAIRLAAAQRLRYRSALSGAGRDGDGGWCCSTSSSCNACTSTSTTCNIEVCCSGA